MFSFLKNRDGNVAIIAGIALLPIIVLAGSAVDIANVITDRSRIQHALDIAALDTARKISADPKFAESDSSVIDFAAAAFHANYADSTLSGRRVSKTDGSVTIDLSHVLERAGGVVREVVLTADSAHISTFMRIMMDEAIETETVAAAVVRNDTFDVVMVLDNSGSMRGSRIRTLRSAATDLSKILMAMNDATGMSDRVQIGLVPFSTYVNVGSTYRNASWLDQHGESPIHSENFDQPANRFELFDDIQSVTWEGCVESRPSPYDVTDALPTRAMPATLFVPAFAPDEPDGENHTGLHYYNDYLDDEGGSCTGRVSEERDRAAASQARICKYDNARPIGVARNSNGVSRGPNFNCRSQPLLPLTSDKSVVLNSIDDMDADGNTNIHMGIMWGWRVLSKAVPFTESRDDDKIDHNKVMILMTDGDNYYGLTSRNHNRSLFGAYGFAALNRIEARSLSERDWLKKSDDKTATACANAKQAGVLVYSIAFKLDKGSTADMLRNCATRSDMFFASNSNEDLRSAFQEIAQSISKLRLSK